MPTLYAKTKLQSHLLTLLLTTYFTKTLTKLNIANNEIGPEGALDFANTLEQNKVTVQPVHSNTHSLFHTDTHDT